MKLAFIGTGYVGLVSGVCFAEKGFEVICVDKDTRKIEMLNKFEMPIYEPGLKELVTKNVTEGRLSFTSDISLAIQQCDVVFIAVGTPSLPNGQADLHYVYEVATSIGQNINGYKVVIDKSTVPVGTGDRVKEIIATNQKEAFNFDVVSAPEFLREGSAISDTMYPDRIVIGVSNDKVARKMEELHKVFGAPIVITDVRSAEMIKYASNAFLATKISFINEIANICERVGADVTEVAKGMGLDKRIGSQFLNAGIGYGGSCFPKDTRALIQIAGNAEHNFELLKAVVDVNNQQRLKVIDKLIQVYEDVTNRKIAVLGLAFKPNTDDMREAPSLDIIKQLIDKGAIVSAYDPIAMDHAQNIIDEDIAYSSTVWDAVESADAVIIVTEWEEFRTLDWKKAANLMKRPVLIDGRNTLDKEEIESLGFVYKAIGR